jgi:hypothetical protein
MPFARARAVLDNLAARGVFVVTLGGGEPLEYPGVFELAAHARALGLWVTTTTGLALDDAVAARCGVFHAVHASLTPNGPAALAVLARHHPNVGVNVLLAHDTLHHVDVAFALARRLRLGCVQLLSLRPEGRAAATYSKRALRDEDLPVLHRVLIGHLRAAPAGGELRVRADLALAVALRKLGGLDDAALATLLAADAQGLSGASATIFPEDLPPDGPIDRAWLARA